MDERMKRMMEEGYLLAKKQEKDQYVEILIKILSAQYDKSIAYTNIIIVAGYAALFTVWSNVKGYMTRVDMMLAALFLTMSCVIFVLWEIYKMVVNSKVTENLQKLMEVKPTDFASKLQEYQRNEQKHNIKFNRRWKYVLIATIGTGLLGAGILIKSFIQQLFTA